MAKAIPRSTELRATDKLRSVFVDLSGPKRTTSLSGARYVMVMKDDYSRHAWMYFLKHKSDSGDAFRKFLAIARADGVPSKVEIARSENGGSFPVVSLENCANSLASSRYSPTPTALNNGGVERALGIIRKAGLAAFLQALIIFPHVQLQPTKSLRTEVVHWACDALNHTAPTANLGNKSPHEMWYGTAAPASPHPFRRPAHCQWKCPSK